MFKQKSIGPAERRLLDMWKSKAIQNERSLTDAGLK